ncbi:hypothetical protein ACSYAD_19595 [Acaryochloris marina NIES-2412]|uniref:hypothetical protein n=1 Tax=Acaryochloris marina TaxID=155978 RepID=UPI0040581CDD
MEKIQSEQESLAQIQQVANKDKPEVTPVTPLDPDITLNDVALPNLTDGFTGEKKLTRKMGFQLMFLGTFVLAGLAMVRGFTSMSGSQAQQSTNTVAAQPISEDERQQYEQTIDELTLALQESDQGKRVDLRTGKGKKNLPKPAVKPSTINRANRASRPNGTRRVPPPAAATARTIPVRRSVPTVRQPIASRPAPQPRIVYRDRPTPAPRPQPVQAPPSRLQPANRISLSQKYEPTQAKPKRQPIKIKRLPRPVRVSTTRVNPTTPFVKPKLTASESGTLVASTSMTGDLIRDMSATNGSVTEPSDSSYSAPNPYIPKGSTPSAGTRAKATFMNPLSWVNRGAPITGQQFSIKLKEDLGSFAKKGSMAIGEVISIEGDIAQVQVVEINGQPIQPGKAIIHHKNTPYLIAKTQKSGGSNFGSRLLRAGLNAGVDQIRGSDIGSRAGNVVNSLVPERSNRIQSSPIFFFEGKDVEIYFLEGFY